MFQKSVYGVFALLVVGIIGVGLLYSPLQALRAAPKATLTATVKKPVILPTVPGLKARQVGTAIRLDWGKPPKNVAYTAYSVLRSDKVGKVGTQISRVAKNKFTFTDTKVVAGRTYYYTVKYVGKIAATNGRQLKITVTKTPVAAKGATPTGGTKTTAPTSSISEAAKPLSTEQPNIFSNPNPTVAAVTDAQASAADSERITTLKQLRIALNQYKAAQESYPSGVAVVLGQQVTSCLNSDGWQDSEDCPYPYFGIIPKDPGASAYVYTALGDSYRVEVKLDGQVEGLSGIVVLTPEGIKKK